MAIGQKVFDGHHGNQLNAHEMERLGKDHASLEDHHRRVNYEKHRSLISVFRTGRFKKLLQIILELNPLVAPDPKYYPTLRNRIPMEDNVDIFTAINKNKKLSNKQKTGLIAQLILDLNYKMYPLSILASGFDYLYDDKLVLSWIYLATLQHPLHNEIEGKILAELYNGGAFFVELLKHQCSVTTALDYITYWFTKLNTFAEIKDAVDFINGLPQHAVHQFKKEIHSIAEVRILEIHLDKPSNSRLKESSDSEIKTFLSTNHHGFFSPLSSNTPVNIYENAKKDPHKAYIHYTDRKYILDQKIAKKIEHDAHSTHRRMRNPG